MKKIETPIILSFLIDCQKLVSHTVSTACIFWRKDMSSIRWVDKLKTNVQRIDEEHKELIRIFAELNEAILSGHSRSVITDVFQGLLNYTRTHFVTEEKLMLHYRYSDFSIHKEDHDRFVAEVMNHLKDYMENRVIPSQKIFHFLAHWLIEHIMGHDKKLGKFLNEQGVL